MRTTTITVTTSTATTAPTTPPTTGPTSEPSSVGEEEYCIVAVYIERQFEIRSKYITVSPPSKIGLSVGPVNEQYCRVPNEGNKNILILAKIILYNYYLQNLVLMAAW